MDKFQKKAKITEILFMLGDQYQEYEVTDRRIDLYCENLYDVDTELLMTAAKMYMNAVPAKKFFPKIGELREIIQHIEMPASEFTVAEEAWWYVTHEIKRVGCYGLPFFDDMITVEVVQIIGWQNIALTEDLEPIRKDFIDKYKQLSWKKKTDMKADETKRLIQRDRKLLK